MGKFAFDERLAFRHNVRMAAGSRPANARRVISEAKETGRSLVLRFSGTEPQLLETEFCCDAQSEAKKYGREDGLVWGKGPGALSLCFLEYVLWRGKGPHIFEGSANARLTLGKLISESKQENWLSKVFWWSRRTTDPRQESVVRDVFPGSPYCLNLAGRNKSIRVHIRINPCFLPPDCVRIEWTGFHRRDAPPGPKELLALHEKIRAAVDAWYETPAPRSNEDPSGESRLARTGRDRGLPKTLLADPLTGVAFAEWKGDDAQWTNALRQAKQRLRTEPGDFFLRAMLIWSVLIRGEPAQVIETIQKTAAYLQSDESSDGARDFHLYSQLWKQKVEALNRGAVEAPAFVRRHLEDTLGRAMLLRWLKFRGNSSRLAVRIKSNVQENGVPFEVRTICEAFAPQAERDWVARALHEVRQLILREQNSGIAHLLLLWLVGRWGSPERIPAALEEACRWLDHYPNADDTLVRWMTLWLAGMLGDHHVETVLAQTRSWLAMPAAEDDCLIRTSYLWLVGSRGDAKAVEAAMAETETWLKPQNNREDDCVRLAYLFALIGRARERGVIDPKAAALAASEIRDWMRSRKDQLATLASYLSDLLDVGG